MVLVSEKFIVSIVFDLFITKHNLDHNGKYLDYEVIEI